MRFSRVGLHNLQNLTTAHTCKPVNIERGQGTEFKTITGETVPNAIYDKNNFAFVCQSLSY